MKNELMNQNDAIDRVLMGLAGVEAPPEIEQRVLRAVQRRAAEQVRPRFTALSSLTYWQRWAVATCVIALWFATSMAVRKRHEPGREGAGVNQLSTPDATFPAAIAMAEARPKGRSVLTVSTHRKNEAKTEVLSDQDALAISEMNAPSKPAPPLPLTQQEKLLAEAVHQDGTNNLSSLRPETRDAQMELSKAEFHDFFEPPPSKDNE